MLVGEVVEGRLGVFLLDPGRVRLAKNSPDVDATGPVSFGHVECFVPSMQNPWIHRLVVGLYIRTRAGFGRTEIL